MSEVRSIKTEQYDFADERICSYPLLDHLEAEGNRMIAEDEMSDRRRMLIGRVVNQVLFEKDERFKDFYNANNLDDLPVAEKIDAR